MNSILAAKNQKILIVEDEVIIGMQLSSQLKKFGYSVEDLVLSGEQAIEKAKESKPDLVLMDIRLKGEMDGITAAGEIKKLGIPVIFLTSYEDDDTLQRAKEVLPYGYLIKPYKNAELKNTIEIALFKHQSELALKERERWLHSILVSLSDLIIATDSSGVVSLMNKPMSEYLKVSSKEVVGENIRSLVRFSEEGQFIDLESLLSSSFETKVGSEASEEKKYRLHSLNSKEGIPISLSVKYLQDSTDEDVVKGIVFVMKDLSQEELLADKIRQHRDLILQTLTEREQETLQYLVDGQGTKDIAVILDISPRTVEFHRQNIMRKFEVHDLTGLVHFALSNQLVDFSKK